MLHLDQRNFMYSKYSDDIYENKAYCIPCTKYVRGITNGLVVATPPRTPCPPRPRFIVYAIT